MIGQVLQSTLREMREFVSSPRLWAILLPVGLVLGVSGPFSTFEILPLVPRVIYWILVAVLTFLGGVFASVFVGTLLSRFEVDPKWVQAGRAFAPVLAVVPLVLIINLLAFPSDEFSVHEMWLILIYAAVIALCVSAVGYVFGGRTNPNQSGSAQSVAQHTAPALLDRIDLPKRGKLISMSVQDHYVEVTTQKGSSLLLIRLSDAMRETDGVDGLQIHRSHWVALDGVSQVLRTNGKAEVLTIDNRRLPISRTYLQSVKDAGLMGK